MTSEHAGRNTVAGVILAAGAGSRFDGPTHKLLAPFRGRPVIQWVCDAVLEAGFNHNVVVAGAVDLSDVLPDEFELVSVEDWAEGQARTLQAAVRAARRLDVDSFVVGLADQPLVPASAWRSVGASAGPIVTASFDGSRRPPVKLEQSVWDLLPEAGDNGARELIRDRPDLVSEIPCSGNPADIDTAEDLARWS